MNEQSLQIANDLLTAMAKEAEAGEPLRRSPVEIGRSVGIQDPLPIARAVRALISRERVRPVGDGYVLVNGEAIQPGERGKVRPRQARASRKGRRVPSAWDVKVGTADARGRSRPLTYSDVGKAVIDRLLELGREVASSRSAVESFESRSRTAESEAEQAKARARQADERARELELKVEMAETNLKNVLSAARGRTATAAPSEDEMSAILSVLRSKGGGDFGAEVEDVLRAGDGRGEREPTG